MLQPALLLKSARILFLIVPWVIFSMYYYSNTYGNFAKTKGVYEYSYDDFENDSLLINTPGCRIPNYMKTMNIREVYPRKGQKSCDPRAIFITKVDDDNIIFRIDEKIMAKYRKIKTNTTYSCYYTFIGQKIAKGKPDYRYLRYKTRSYFRNGTISLLKEELISVKCTQKTGKKFSVYYTDSYILIKKIKNNISLQYKNRWNVLLIGMDTMSRARAYSSMPKTVNYMKKHGWLDYRGYQKVGYNTFPNVASFLSGRSTDEMEKSCAKGMDGCNKLYIWSDFQQFGYKTAYGEDFIRLPDTFSRYNGFKNKPTDHYMRPLFLTGEFSVSGFECTYKQPSAKHILNYAMDFTRSYINETFYGLFWLNSYSHNLNNNPTLLDSDMKTFFETLKKNRVMDNTFVFFLSDHGLRTGIMREQYESYYDERLPMLFTWVPETFRQHHREEYEYMQSNQNMLITPYDLYLTMWDICRMTNGSAPIKTSKACPQCKSLMSHITPHRTCTDVGVSEKWCTCHTMNKTSVKNEKVKHSLDMVLEYLQKKSEKIKTENCTKCKKFELKKLHRAHVYSDNDVNYYVLALLLTGDVGFEATVVERNNTLTILQPTYAISVYNVLGSCALGRYDKAYCLCVRERNCTYTPPKYRT